MRFLYIDCDTLRPDHLGCYGYHRNTSPNIDQLAKQGLRFTNHFVSDAPCLPSRSALFNGRFGIHTGVVGHGGTAADLRIEGESRAFGNSPRRAPWVARMRQAGCHTASISPFADRHAAWWFYNGFAEVHDPGRRGGERADEVMALTEDWLERNAARENWFLQVNFWDPHTPYRTPDDFGNPFANEPLPAWHTEEVRARNWEGYGPHSARECQDFTSDPTPMSRRFPNVPRQIASMDDYRTWIDGYDTGISYMDYHFGRILDLLDEKGILDDTVIIVGSDHGENQGELNVYGDHQTADYVTCRTPLVVRWPGVTPSNRAYDGLVYNLDLPPTVMKLLGEEASPEWDGVSFAPALRGEPFPGHDAVVVSQCAWSCQRGVRWDRWMLVRTYHDGLKDLPGYMLFDVEKDSHELNNLASAHPEIVAEGVRILEKWTADNMQTSDCAEDPLWRVMREGGPLHTRGRLASYCERLRATGRGRHADALEQRHAS